MFTGLKQQFQKTGLLSPGRLLNREPEPQGRPGRNSKAQPPAPADRGVGRLIRETRSELRKVTWPTQDQVQKLTILVIAVSVAMGLLMGGIDFVFEKLLQAVLGVG